MATCCLCRLRADSEHDSLLNDYLTDTLLPFLNQTISLLHRLSATAESREDSAAAPTPKPVIPAATKSCYEENLAATKSCDEENLAAIKACYREGSAATKNHNEEEGSAAIKDCNEEGPVVITDGNEEEEDEESNGDLKCQILDRKEIRFKDEPILVLLCKGRIGTFRAVLRETSVVRDLSGREGKLGWLRTNDKVALRSFTTSAQKENSSSTLQTFKVSELQLLRAEESKKRVVKFPTKKVEGKKRKKVTLISDANECSQCRSWNSEVAHHVSSKHSRHKFVQPVNATPRGFWDVDFPPTQLTRPSREPDS